MTTIRAGSPLARGLRITMDGAEVRDCMEADALNGWVDIWVRDPASNRPMLTDDGLPVLERRHGAVTFTWTALPTPGGDGKGEG